MVVSGDELYNAVIAGEIPNISSLVSDLKTHVKKDNVNLAYVPKYFEALSIVMDAADPAVQTLAFSVICHLVKRVSIQDRTGKMLASQSFLVLPTVIPRIADPKLAVNASARRALEAYWLLAPSKVEQALVDFGITNRSLLIINECVVWLNHILTEINPHFKLDAFFGPLAATLAKHASNTALVENIKVLFANYYDLKQNRLHKFELQKVLESHNVSVSLRKSIMGTDTVLSRLPDMRTHHSTPVVPPIPTIDRPHKSHEVKQPVNRDSRPALPIQEPKHTIPTQLDELFATQHSDIMDDATLELAQLTQSLPNYIVDTSMPGKDVDSHDAIYRLISDMSPFFDSKESERNWSKREASIQALRKLIRGNAQDLYRSDLFLAIKSISEGVQKALLSLRTTLSVSSCMLVKEMAIFFESDFDALAEIFLPTLIRLCSATKHMTHTNANVATSAILINCTINPRIVQRITLAATDKSASTRSYAAFWLEIYMIRTHSQSQRIEPAEKVLPKLLGDPNSQVRQAAKDAYWRYAKYFPDQADKLLSKLDTKVVRAIERSRPASGRVTPSLLTKKSRPSLKEAIMAKNKQLRTKAANPRSNSSLLPRRPSEMDIDEIHLPVGRTPSDPIRKPTTTHVEHESAPHYAQSTFSHRSTTTAAFVSPKASSVPPTNSATTRSVSPPHHSSLGEQNQDSLHQKSPEVVKNTSPSFDSRSDPILKFISSSQEEFIREGINLLRYAIIGDEEISNQIVSMVRKVSIAHVELLRPLFEEGENLFKKSSRIFHIEDFFRVCAILLPASDKTVDNMVSLFQIEEVYETVNTLLSYVADLDNIVDERQLVMQIIRFKSKIIEMLVQFLNKVIVKMPISDVKFANLATSLFELVPIVHSTHTYPEYQTLLQSLHAINKVVFASELSLVGKNIRTEVEQIVGIDNALQYIGEGTVFNMTDLTQISPGKPPLGLSPLKRPSDFTMLIPGESDRREIINQPAEDKEDGYMPIETSKRVEDTPNLDQMDLGEDSLSGGEDNLSSGNVPDVVASESGSIKAKEDTPSRLNRASAEGNQFSLAADDNNVFSSSGSEDKRTDFFAKLNSPDFSHELADDFAQVKLSTHTNSIQHFIDKVDPLNRISKKSRQISIFEDSKSGSPQKVREYNYTGLNWFNFLVAKLSLENNAEDLHEPTIAEFKLLCKSLGKSKLSGHEFMSLLTCLQSEQNAEFNHYYANEGFALVEQSLWSFFLSSAPSDHMNGLIVAKQLLINRTSVNLVHLWHVLLDLSSESTESSHELEVAIGEIFDETLCGLYSSAELFHVVSKTMKGADSMNTYALRFGVESLYKLMSARTLALIINEDLIHKVDEVLHGLLDHKDTFVRKFVLQTYGKLVRAARVSDASASNKSSSAEKPGVTCIDELLVHITGPQKRLIEYFSQS